MVRRVPLRPGRSHRRPVGDGVPRDSRWERERGLVRGRERDLEGEVQEVEAPPEVRDGFRGELRHSPRRAPPSGDGVRRGEGPYYRGVVGEAGGPSGAGLPAGAHLQGCGNPVQLGAGPAPPGGNMLGCPLDLEPAESRLQGGGDLGFRPAAWLPNLGVEVSRHEVPPGGHTSGADAVADAGGYGEPVVRREIHVVNVLYFPGVRLCHCRRQPVAGRVDDPIGHDIREGGEDGHSSTWPPEGVVLGWAGGLRREHLRSREETAPDRGRHRGPVGLLEGDHDAL